MAMWKNPSEAAGQSVHEDDEIRAALRANDTRGALTLMMNRFGDEVFRFAYAVTRSRHLADEVRQQVFVEVYRDLAGFAGRASLRAWVLGITRHRCLDATKKQRRWTNRFKNDPPTDEEPDDHELEREVDRGKLAKILAACLAKARGADPPARPRNTVAPETGGVRRRALPAASPATVALG
jgi:DNA-directed RNA polymerase specialized sigma24 family protein